MILGDMGVLVASAIMFIAEPPRQGHGGTVLVQQQPSFTRRTMADPGQCYAMACGDGAGFLLLRRVHGEENLIIVACRRRGKAAFRGVAARSGISG